MEQGIAKIIDAYRPRFPLNDAEGRIRFFHHIEHRPGWEYQTTSSLDVDDWDHMATRPAGFQLNTDRWPLIDELMDGATRVSPGVIRKSGKLFAHWRRQVP